LNFFAASRRNAIDYSRKKMRHVTSTMAKPESR